MRKPRTNPDAMSEYDPDQINYKVKLTCFTCRKVFKKVQGVQWQHLYIKSPSGDALKCPQCGDRLCDVGIHFRAPKKSDIELWEVAKRLIEAGIRYDADRYSELPGKRPTHLRDVDKFVEEYKQRNS